MSALSKRIAKLEGAAGGEELVVTINSFGDGDGEYNRLEDTQGVGIVTRRDNESEDEFLARGERELVAQAKKEGSRGVIVLKAMHGKE